MHLSKLSVITTHLYWPIDWLFWLSISSLLMPWLLLLLGIQQPSHQYQVCWCLGSCHQKPGKGLHWVLAYRIYKLSVANQATSHYLNQPLLTISEVLWHLFQGNAYFNTQDINTYVEFEIYTLEIKMYHIKYEGRHISHSWLDMVTPVYMELI